MSEPEEKSKNVNQNQLLNEKQLRAAQLLATGAAAKTVSETIGIAEETISRWRCHDKNFKIYLMELLMEAHEAAKTRMQALVQKAVTAVESSLDDTSLTAKDRFAIAVKIIEICSYDNSCLGSQIERLQRPLSTFSA